MPRRGSVPKRIVPPDPTYGSRLVSKFVNKLMWDGNKNLAEAILSEAMEIIAKKSGKSPLDVLEQAIRNVTPVLEVRPRRVGGATYQVPIEVRSERRTALAIRWLVQYARARGERTMSQRLAAELMEAAQGTGNAVKKKEDTHKMAEANKAFAHYRW